MCFAWLWFGSAPRFAASGRVRVVPVWWMKQRGLPSGLKRALPFETRVHVTLALLTRPPRRESVYTCREGQNGDFAAVARAHVLCRADCAVR